MLVPAYLNVINLYEKKEDSRWQQQISIYPFSMYRSLMLVYAHVPAGIHGVCRRDSFKA